MTTIMIALALILVIELLVLGGITLKELASDQAEMRRSNHSDGREQFIYPNER